MMYASTGVYIGACCHQCRMRSTSIWFSEGLGALFWIVQHPQIVRASETLLVFCKDMLFSHQEHPLIVPQQPVQTANAFLQTILGQRITQATHTAMALTSLTDPQSLLQTAKRLYSVNWFQSMFHSALHLREWLEIHAMQPVEHIRQQIESLFAQWLERTLAVQKELHAMPTITLPPVPSIRTAS